MYFLLICLVEIRARNYRIDKFLLSLSKLCSYLDLNLRQRNVKMRASASGIDTHVIQVDEILRCVQILTWRCTLLAGQTIDRVVG